MRCDTNTTHNTHYVKRNRPADFLNSSIRNVYECVSHRFHLNDIDVCWYLQALLVVKKLSWRKSVDCFSKIYFGNNLNMT